MPVPSQARAVFGPACLYDWIPMTADTLHARWHHRAITAPAPAVNAQINRGIARIKALWAKLSYHHVLRVLPTGGCLRWTNGAHIAAWSSGGCDSNWYCLAAAVSVSKQQSSPKELDIQKWLMSESGLSKKSMSRCSSLRKTVADLQGSQNCL